MRSVVFNFKASTAQKDQDQVLARLNTHAGVIRAARLKPEAQDPDVRRMAFAYVDDSLDVEILLTQLSHFPEIDSASLPARRHLIT